MHILVIHGPNLNMLGRRDPAQYGSYTLTDINGLLEQKAQGLGATIDTFQSNSEGAIIDYLQEYARRADGILINPGALTHYGYALRDALSDTDLPIVEVHLSNILERENFRKVDVLDGMVITRIMGKKEQSYLEGLTALVTHITDTASAHA